MACQFVSLFLCVSVCHLQHSIGFEVVWRDTVLPLGWLMCTRNTNLTRVFLRPMSVSPLRSSMSELRSFRIPAQSILGQRQRRAKFNTIFQRWHYIYKIMEKWSLVLLVSRQNYYNHFKNASVSAFNATTHRIITQNTSYTIFSTQSTVWTEMGADLITWLWWFDFELRHWAELLRMKTSSEVPAGVTDHTLEAHWRVTVSLLIQHVIKDRVGH